MIRRVRPKVNAYLKKRLEVYQKRVNQAVASGGDHRPVLDREWLNFRDSKAGEIAVQDLSGASHKRCYYCECETGSAIDHFKPKSPYPATAFRWTNLNWGCHICNSLYKLDQWSGDLLNPGGREETADYFVLDEVTGRLLPDRSRPPADQQKATETTRILGLNRDELAERRSQYAQDFLDDLQAYIQNPDGHREAILLRYLRPEGVFRTVIRLFVRSRDQAVNDMIEQWLSLSRNAATELQAQAWWPIR